MRCSDNGVDLIKRFEGCRLEAYRCPAGVPTIGYGATGPDVKLGMQWTQEQADERLRADLKKFEEGVEALLGDAPTTQGQFDALVSFAYNCGLLALAKSTLLKRHRAGEYLDAAHQFLRWNRANGRVLPGLTRRRQAEAKLYGEG